MKERLREKAYLVFWSFFAGGIIGYFAETIWCFFAFGGYSSRTSNLFFPFSIIWAVGTVLLITLVRDRIGTSMLWLFLKGIVLSGTFELFCGYAGEKILGVTFWDYTGMPLHIGRYIDVYICLIWGALCIVWVRYLYPCWKKIVEKISMKSIGKKITVFLLCFMVVSNYVSGLALLRMNKRNNGIEAQNRIEKLLDNCFPDSRMQEYFPKMKYLDGSKIYIP